MKNNNTIKEEYAWYKLDNAAKLYPAIMNSKWSPMFRVSIEMNEDIDGLLLQQALEQMLPRMHTFRLRMKRGFFWYYFETNENIPQVQPDVANPCLHINMMESRGFLFRVRYYNSRIALEIFHALSDGYGAMVFLKTLAAQYLRLRHNLEIPCEKGVLDITAPPDIDEMQDAYVKYSKFDVLRSRKESKAYQLKGTYEPPYIVNVITGYIPLDKILIESKKFGLSLTEYLVSVYIMVLDRHQRMQLKKRKFREVKISVPVNMRKFYNTKSLRNFSMFVNPGINPNYGEFTFEEIASYVHHFLRSEINEKMLNSQMAKNVSSERNIITRIMPLFLKKILLNLVYNVVGESRFTSALSNLGAVEIPEEMKPYVKRFGFILGRPRMNAMNVGVVSFGNELSITFTRAITETEIIKDFFTHLIKSGIPVKIESNER